MNTPETRSGGSLKPVGSAVCEMPKYNLMRRRFGKRRVLQTCGKLAWYIWTPRSRPEVRTIACKECGEALAGNFTDELTRYMPNVERSHGAENH